MGDLHPTALRYFLATLLGVAIFKDRDFGATSDGTQMKNEHSVSDTLVWYAATPWSKERSELTRIVRAVGRFIFLVAFMGWLSFYVYGQELIPPQRPIERPFFGLHMHHLVVPHQTGNLSQWPYFQFGSWRLWGAYVAWRDLEPERGQWKFDVLDRYVALAQEHGVDLLLTFGYTPKWASARPNEICAFGTTGCAAEPLDIADWENYVSTVAKRYKGRIKYYEIWNEPAFLENETALRTRGLPVFYSGTVKKLVEMGNSTYRIIKQIDPDAKVVSPSIVSTVDRLSTYFAAGGYNALDIVGYHFYTDQPEKILSTVIAVKKLMAQYGIVDKPLWNTEMGFFFERPGLQILPSKPKGSFEDVLSMDTGAAYVVRSLVLAAAAGIDRFYWYDWDSERPPAELPMGLASKEGTVADQAGTAYATAIRWLIGATIEVCRSPNGKLWVCTLKRRTRTAWLVWSVDGPVAVTIPINISPLYTESLGNTRSLKIQDINDLKIGASPVLLKSDPLLW